MPDDELPTTPGHAIPSIPPDFDPENSDAPEWSKDLFRALRSQRQELAQSARESAGTLREISVNQKLTLAEVRTLSRRVETIERRLGIGEQRFEKIEERLEKVEKRLAEIEVGLFDDP